MGVDATDQGHDRGVAHVPGLITRPGKHRVNAGRLLCRPAGERRYLSVAVTTVAQVTEFEDPPAPLAAGQVSETYRGPVRLRGDQQDKGTSTTDQRLLDSRGPSDWVHTDPWRGLRIPGEVIEGFGTLAELGPAIGVFGSARTPQDHPSYAQAEQVARKLVDAGFAVITGGGP